MPECRLWVYNAEIFSGGSSNLWKPVGFVAKQNSDFWFFGTPYCQDSTAFWPSLFSWSLLKYGNVYVLIGKFSESPSSWNTLFITLITGWNDFSFPQSSRKLQSFEAGLTKKLNKMGVEHFVIAPLPPTDHLQVKIMCISKSMKLITPPFSQTQGGVACVINIQQKCWFKTNVNRW